MNGEKCVKRSVHDLFSSPNIKMRLAENIARVGTKDVYSVLVGESEGKEELGRPRLW